MANTPNANPLHRHRHRRYAFTIVELLTAMTLMAVLVGGMASAIILANHAIDDGSGPLAAVVNGSEALDIISADLTYALSISGRTANQLVFTIADRNDDDTDETITYSWSGTAGDSLIRQYNGVSTELALDVRQFALSYTETTTTIEGEPGTNESAETVIAGFEASFYDSGYELDMDDWVGACFEPQLPDEALSWRMTRLKFQAKADGSDNDLTTIEVRTASAELKPASVELYEFSMWESSLTNSYLWQEFVLGEPLELTPEDSLCVVLTTKKNNAAQIRTKVIEDPIPSWMKYVHSTNKGDYWYIDIDYDFPYYVYGTVITPTPPDVSTLYTIKAVDITLRLGDDPDARVETTVATLNAPEMLVE